LVTTANGVVNGGHPMANEEDDDTDAGKANNGGCNPVMVVDWNPWWSDVPLIGQPMSDRGNPYGAVAGQLGHARVLSRQGNVYVLPVPIAVPSEDLNNFVVPAPAAWLRWAWYLWKDPSIEQQQTPPLTALENTDLFDANAMSSRRILKWGTMWITRTSPEYQVSQTEAGTSIGLPSWNVTPQPRTYRIPIPKVKGFRFDRATRLRLFCQLRASPIIGPNFGGSPDSYNELASVTQVDNLPNSYPTMAPAYNWATNNWVNNTGGPGTVPRVSYWPDLRFLCA